MKLKLSGMNKIIIFVLPQHKYDNIILKKSKGVMGAKIGNKTNKNLL